MGKERSARTEGRILEVALEVFADRGAEAPVIDDFVRAAGIARGTFYNHFESVEALLRATSEATTRRVLEAIEGSMQQLEGPALRLGVGLRLFLKHARAQPQWSRFVARVWHLGGLELPLRDLAEGIRLGHFHVADREAARDVVIGAVREALARLGEKRAGASYCDAVVRLCFQVLRAQELRITQALEHPLPSLSALSGDPAGVEPRRARSLPRRR